MKAFIGFAGFGGPEIVLHELGVEAVGVERNSDIAAVARTNGHNIITADILDIRPEDHTDCDLAHFSPPCPNFSVAKVGAEESELDIDLAKWIARFIVVVKPRFFTLENVWAYRKSLSWLLIWYTLLEEGYGVDAWNLNAADYGVSQTRRRMIVIARRDGRHPAKPFPSHAKTGDLFTEPWLGWYETVEDLIPNLPDTRPAPWQIKSMPDELKDTFLIGQGALSLPKAGSQPSDTITANTNQTGVKAFVIGKQHQTSNTAKNRVIQNCTADNPIWTITASESGDTRAFSNGHWVSMTPRALARFQGFPDWYQLPTNRALACRGIGNALPPGVYRAIIKSLR